MFDARDVLLKAASRIEEEGMWCQHMPYDVDGLDYEWNESLVELLARRQLRVPECATGAIASAIVGLLGHLDDVLYQNAIYRCDGFLQGPPLWRFNDTPGRTAPEVAAAMRAAAS